MVDGDITHAHFLNPNDLRIAAVIRRVVIEFADNLGLLDHELIIKTQNGRVIQARGSGEFLPVPNTTAILEKYALPIVGPTKIHELQQRVAKLDDAADVHQLAQCLA